MRRKSRKIKLFNTLMFLVSFIISFKLIPNITNSADQEYKQLNSYEHTEINNNEVPLNTGSQSQSQNQNITGLETVPLLKEANAHSIQDTDSAQILIYHTHNRESWLPELTNATKPEQAFDSKINVTLLGQYLAEQLSKEGLKVIHSNEDYPTRVHHFNYAKSYVYSKEFLIKELAAHKNIKYVFDLHRDSESRKQTTITYQDQSYAQVYFVVGEGNVNRNKIMDFAARLQDKLNERIPGLSKGIYQKDSSTGNGKYNQSLSDFSALIEIGGVDNTLKESYRTITILADVIHDIWHEDNKSQVIASAF